MDDKIIGLLQAIEENTLLSAKSVLTTHDVVLLTGISETHLRNMRMRREIPYYRKSGKLIYYDRKEIEDWMKENRVDTFSECGERVPIKRGRNSNE